MTSLRETIDVSSVVPYLRARGVVTLDGPVEASALDGGVSNEVLAVSGPNVDVVVKQALPQLRVADEWLAKVERIVTEGEALRLAATITAGRVPEVLDLDADGGVLTITRAPSDWRNWKQELLAGRAETAVAATLGDTLAAWHLASAGDTATLARFDDAEAFVQLRVDPYHRTVARRLPEVAERVTQVADTMLETRRCLVHGDYSPKNVLAGADGLWVLDFEVAHAGDPAFDVAFLLNHLVLKSVHRPEGRDAYRACATAFLDAYEGRTGAGWVGDEGHVVRHLGCLLLARAVGKSPAEYLGDAQRRAVRDLGVRVLLEPLDTLDAVWRAG